ncbi:hypothetical protein, partial [Roseibium sp. RKSG952]|uniref:hypothetical protein n=1 Tax=Roseibium sp. RKSG952 TaxID=2529384 RepID=UPI001AD8B973
EWSEIVGAGHINQIVQQHPNHVGDHFTGKTKPFQAGKRIRDLHPMPCTQKQTDEQFSND